MERKRRIYKVILIRLLYIIPLAFFIWMLVDDWQYLHSESSIGVSYIYVYTIPILIFTYQTIRNSILGWFLVMFLYALFLFVWTTDLVHAYSLVGVKYTSEQYYSGWFFVILYIFLGLVYFKFRPRKLII